MTHSTPTRCTIDYEVDLAPGVSYLTEVTLTNKETGAVYLKTDVDPGTYGLVDEFVDVCDFVARSLGARIEVVDPSAGIVDLCVS